MCSCVINVDFIFIGIFRCAGLKCQQIIGLVKGSIYKIGEKVTGENIWAAVLIDNIWRLVDPHWGSASISDPNTGEWTPLDVEGNTT